MEQLYLLLFSINYLVAFIFSVLMSVAIRMLQGKFSLGCGLYIELEKESTRYDSSLPSWMCECLKYIPVAILVIIAFLLAYHLYPAIMVMSKRKRSSFAVFNATAWDKAWPKYRCAINFLLAVITLVAACIVSAGFSKTCIQLKTLYEIHANKRCKEIFGLVTWNEVNPDNGIYPILVLAEVSAWISFFTFVIAVTISFYLLFRKESYSVVSQTEIAMKNRQTHI